MPKFLDFLKGTVLHQLSFQILTLISIFFIVLELIVFGYQFVFFGESDTDSGLYMNLTKGPMEGTCSAKPFDEHTPLDFTYITDQGEYSYTCMHPLFFQVIAHLAVSFLVVGLSFSSYIFGLMLVQRKAVVFFSAYLVAALAMSSIGIAEISIAVGSKNFCENELLKQVDFTLSETQPTGIKCHFQHYIVFGIYEIIVGILGFVHGSLIATFYLRYRKQKIEQRKEETKPYEDLKFDDNGKVVNKKVNDDGSQQIELGQHVESHVGAEETSVSDSKTEHAIISN